MSTSIIERSAAQQEVAVAHDTHDEHHGHHIIEFTPQQRLAMNRLGFWLFLISETFLFSGILVARIVLLRNEDGFTRPELDQQLGLLITSILLLSSFAINFGEVAISRGDRNIFLAAFGAAILMGFVFTGGVVYEWSIAHDSPSESIEGGMFFFMTGMHALHVITGIGFLIAVWWNGYLGNYDENHWGVEASALYWHFVDVVWVFFYVALYLIGNVPHHG
ncbi:MAG: heme-copper oxidase subunit III [Phototrophicales bacterium]|nr:MAG: heme-copper oxidase subunit III [Phototrophicales bacterium]